MVKIILKGMAFSIERVVSADQVKATIDELKSSGLSGDISVIKI